MFVSVYSISRTMHVKSRQAHAEVQTERAFVEPYISPDELLIAWMDHKTKREFVTRGDMAIVHDCNTCVGARAYPIWEQECYHKRRGGESRILALAGAAAQSLVVYISRC